MALIVCVCVCAPDCCGAKRGRGASGDVRVVLGVQLIINSILSVNKKKEHRHYQT